MLPRQEANNVTGGKHNLQWLPPNSTYKGAAKTAFKKPLVQCRAGIWSCVLMYMNVRALIMVCHCKIGVFHWTIGLKLPRSSKSKLRCSKCSKPTFLKIIPFPVLSLTQKKKNTGIPLPRNANLLTFSFYMPVCFKANKCNLTSR